MSATTTLSLFGFRRTPAICAAALSLMTATTAHAQALKQTDFEDGTGSVGIPAGWKLVGAYHGSVNCIGPQGMAVLLGAPSAILRPESPVAQLPTAASSPKAPVGDLVGGLREVLSKTFHAHLASLRARPATSVFPGVPAKYFLYTYTQNGKPFTCLGYFTTIYPGMNAPTWGLYGSVVVAPTSLFAKNLPMLVSIWKSWRPNGNKPKAGSPSAIIDEGMERRDQMFNEVQQKFHQILVDQP